MRALTALATLALRLFVLRAQVVDVPSRMWPLALVANLAVSLLGASFAVEKLPSMVIIAALSAWLALYAFGILAMVKLTERFQRVFAAVLLVDTLVTFLLLPILAVESDIKENDPLLAVFGLYYMALQIYAVFFVYGRIWRQALAKEGTDPWYPATLVAVGQFLSTLQIASLLNSAFIYVTATNAI
jgi:hypothetical protein